jgi:hypothetical protein
MDKRAKDKPSDVKSHVKVSMGNVEEIPEKKMNNKLTGL